MIARTELNPAATTQAVPFQSLGARVTPLLALFAACSLLATCHIADGDLWAKLAIGASVWLRGEVPHQDAFAFTPVLPHYIDHEWGAGVLFYGVLKFLGAPGLMLLKMLLFVAGLGAAFQVGKRHQVSSAVLYLLIIPCALALLNGYIPTIRSHAFTFCFFALVLWLLNLARNGSWAAVAFGIGCFALWANVHGGFVAGLGAVGLHTLEAVFFRRSLKQLLVFSVGAFLVSFITPYGLDYWRYLLPAILHPRASIEEWKALPLFAWDMHVAFRLLFALVVSCVLLGWNKVETKSWSGLALLAITAYLGWSSRRHGPFFALATLAYAGPYLQAALQRLALPRKYQSKAPAAVFGLYVVLCAFSALTLLPKASWQVFAPVGHDPVREADILMHSQLSGNLAVPFGWGSYAAWRLHPRIKISNDGRYEAVYPESTFEMNNAFFEKRGADWDRLLRNHPVDFVMLDLQHERLKPADLESKGYKLIWMDENVSALMALEKHAATLTRIARELPPTTINPLDPAIPEGWWR